jgi:FAD/FMN-containing dehydrogenase
MTIPFNTFASLQNFGHSLRAGAYLFCPQSVEEIEQAFRLAKEWGLTVALRGAGLSYNDAALNGGGIVLDLQRMNRILAWDSESGVLTAEPGVTLAQVWQRILPDGWWLPVVSGTMKTTLGGCLAMNIHGKNNYRAGPIGEHVLEFTALLPSGAEVTCSPTKNGDLFHAMIGGLGLLGAFTSITMRMKKVHSGLLNVRAWSVPNLATHLEAIAEHAPQHDYTVGWLDPTARGRSLGRGQIHTADYLAEGEDAHAAHTCRLEYQTLPSTFFGVIPKGILYHFMKPFMNNSGVWLVNTAKYLLAHRARSYRQSHAAFHFLLDYVPNWELAYGRDGLIQYQSFLPVASAQEAWREILRLSHQRGLPAYLGVTKRHRPDKFLLTYAVDGFSLALDFKVTAANRAPLQQMLAEFDRIVLAAGGRFYFAKNSETSAETARRFLGEETIARFRALKKRCDPYGLLATDLYRRIFGD